MKIKRMFSTPRKTIVSIACILVAMAAIAAGVFFTSCAIAKSNSITEEAAFKAALADSGADASQAVMQKAEFELEQGKYVYNIEFTAAGIKYEYVIKAADGSVLSRHSQVENGQSLSYKKQTPAISADKAKAIAYSDADVKKENVIYTECALECETGIMKYEIEFYTTTTEYEYEINAMTGEIINKMSKATEQTPSPTTDASADMLSLDKAKEIALNDADVNQEDAVFTKAKLYSENGISLYDIEFYTESFEYEYEINAYTGAIVEKETKKHSNSAGTGNTQTSTIISLDKAKEIALDHAGVKESEATFTKTKTEKAHGTVIYEIEFYTSTKNYEYEINAYTGGIIENSCDNHSHNSGNNNSTDVIGVNKAKEIALKDAGVSEADATFTKTKTNKKHGTTVYEIEFYTSNKEYEYTINAYTGAIIESECKNNGHHGSSNQNGGNYNISLDEAKKIAVQHAGLSLSQVVFKKAKLEKDHGNAKYEIEFVYNGIEYEYSIDPCTGEILKCESEHDD